MPVISSCRYCGLYKQFSLKTVICSLQRLLENLGHNHHRDLPDYIYNENGHVGFIWCSCQQSSPGHYWLLVWTQYNVTHSQGVWSHDGDDKKNRYHSDCFVPHNWRCGHYLLAVFSNHFGLFPSGNQSVYGRNIVCYGK